MSKRFPIILALTLVGAATGFVVGQFGSSSAQAQETRAVPKAWGNLRSGNGFFFYFEAPDGTIRLYDASSGTVQITITRQ
jgi:hypothetical protein